MANIFLSYAREDSVKAAIITRALSARGWTVWWDRSISPGKTFDDVIEDALDHASCVVVLWSKASVSSHWVRAEAAEGSRRGILVPALIEPAKIPLEFRRVQAADFTSWHGDPADPEFEQFVLSITTLIQRETLGPLKVPPAQIRGPAFDSMERTSLPNRPEQPPAKGRRPQAVVWATTVAIVAALAGGFAWWSMTRDDVAPRGTERPLEQSRTLPQPSASPLAASGSRVVVPSIVGLRVDDARAQLERIGLSVGNVRATNERGPTGTITAQRPVAGERISPGETVDLVVTGAVAATAATGPSAVPNSKTENKVAKGIEVPNLTGLSIEVARDRVARRGLAVGNVTALASDMPANSVLSQEPAPGTRQPPGTPLSLVISEAPRVAPANTDASGGGRSPARNSITNIRTTDRSPSEVTIDADVFYDGAGGTDGVYLVARAMNGKAQSAGISARYSSPLRVGPGHSSVTLYMVGTVAEATSTDVEVCIHPQRRGPPTVPILCHVFPLARKWVLPMNRVTSFRGADVSTYELRANIFFWYDGRHGASEISLLACPRGADPQALARGIRCGQAPLQVGPNNVTVTLMMGGDAQIVESTGVEVCLVGPRNTRVSECQVYRHQKRWSRSQRSAFDTRQSAR